MHIRARFGYNPVPNKLKQNFKPKPKPKPKKAPKITPQKSSFNIPFLTLKKT